jgi:hypothetical protein
MTDFKADNVTFKSADGATTLASIVLASQETTLIMADISSLMYDEGLADKTGRGLKRSATVDQNTVGLFGVLKLSADGHYDNAVAASVGSMPCTAMGLGTGTGTKTLLLDGIARDDTWTWTVGSPLYVSETPGQMTHTPPATASACRQCVGFAMTAKIVRFNPNLAMVVNAAA